MEIVWMTITQVFPVISQTLEVWSCASFKDSESDVR